MIVSKQPLAILEVLQGEPYNFKLKGSGPISFQMGCGFTRDEHNVLCMDPKKYIEKMVQQSYKQMFGTQLGRKPYSPLEEGDHPELDTTSGFLNEDEIVKYQCMVG